MKNFHQNLLIALALGLCGLCAWQWYAQTLQREQMIRLDRANHDQSVAIQGYTNSIKTMEHQIFQMDEQMSALKGTLKTNEETIVSQRREINKLEAQSEALTGEINQYKAAVDTLQAKLKEAYDGIKKQDEGIKQLVIERDEFVKKYNDSVKDRNDVVARYNELVVQVGKLEGGKAPDK
jgi:chromosome segregation ATPase